MSQVVSGRFETEAAAEEALRDLAHMGTPIEALRFIPTQITRPREGPRSGTDILIGIIFGALLGGSVGALAGVIFLSLPIVGPMLASYLLTFGLTSNLAGMVAGVVVGGLLGAYLGGISWAGVASRSFGALVAARVDESVVGEAAEVLRRHGALNAH